MSGIASPKSNADMTLADFTSAGLIIPQFRSHDVAGVIRELSDSLHREGLANSSALSQAAIDRERLGGTACEAGLAFPHARLPEVKQLSFSLGRANTPVAWGPHGTFPVRLVFLIAAPATASTTYLSLISGLARLSQQPGLVEKLYAAQDTLQILKALQQVPVGNSPPEKDSRQSS
jgi:mannitol/fructose-specific phosphotransferase system IIA component (Ntr-type)